MQKLCIHLVQFLKVLTFSITLFSNDRETGLQILNNNKHKVLIRGYVMLIGKLEAKNFKYLS